MSKKDKYMMSLICGILKNGTNKLTKQKQSHRCRKQPYDQGLGGGRDKLGLTKTYYVSNKYHSIQYGTGNATQYSGLALYRKTI